MNGIVRLGSTARLRAALDRAAAGERVTLGFIGGSITQGFSASSPETCYAHRVYDWWRETFGGAEYINAGIGATTSAFGAVRVEEDLLRYGPDVVFVEFSVNDQNTDHFAETYESLLRRILRWSGAPAVVLLHNMLYDTGYSTEETHSAVGAHYDLPAVSLHRALWESIRTGVIEARSLTPDGLHPNDAGHALLAGLVTDLLETVRQSEANAEPPLPPPLTANAYEHSVRYRNDNAAPELRGFVPDPRPQEGITDIFSRGWTASAPGDAIVFEVEGTCLAVQYRKTIRRPAPVAVAVVDGAEGAPIVLDANFAGDWGECLYLQDLLVHGEPGPHRVEIRLTQTHPDDRLPFYLVSIISSE